jgi:hypothetical protein
MSRRAILVTLIIALFTGLVSTVGLVAYRYGQQLALNVTPEPIVLVLPSPTPTIPPPLAIVTNTPTATASPSPTPGPTNTPTTPPSPTPIPTNTPAPTPTPIIFDIQELGRLETTEFAMRTVLDLENDPSNLWQEIFGTDKLMLVAEGEVVAGFDLQKVDQKKDIQAQGTTVKITLPRPEILYSRIDNAKTFVYERKTGLLTQPDPTLEGRARLLAEQDLVKWAEQRGIYQKAEAAGRVYLENFLRSLGFTKITIEVKKKGS